MRFATSLLIASSLLLGACATNKGELGKRSYDKNYVNQVAWKYLDTCLKQIEQVANRGAPNEEKKTLVGAVSIYLEIGASGDILLTKVEKSSGDSALDASALDAIKNASPCSPFPDVLRSHFDVVAATRTFFYSPWPNVNPK